MFEEFFSSFQFSLAQCLIYGVICICFLCFIGKVVMAMFTDWNQGGKEIFVAVSIGLLSALFFGLGLYFIINIKFTAAILSFLVIAVVWIIFKFIERKMLGLDEELTEEEEEKIMQEIRERVRKRRSK